MSTTPVISLSRPDELVAAVPYLLGYHPSDSLVLLGVRDGGVTITARCDLPTGSGLEHEARDVVSIVARQGLDTLIAAGYGPPGMVTPVIDAVRRACRTIEVELAEALRVTDGRYWSYTCTTGCCPPEGRPVPPEHDPVAVGMIATGKVAHADRDSLTATITADPAVLKTMAPHLALTDPVPPAPTAVADALDAHLAAGTFPDLDETARLLLWLRHDPAVADHTIHRIEARPHGAYLDLLRWLARHAPQRYATEPAIVLAFAAWRAGNGVLAGIAIDQALAAAPHHRAAQALQRLLRSGVGPTQMPPLADMPTRLPAGT